MGDESGDARSIISIDACLLYMRALRSILAAKLLVLVALSGCTSEPTATPAPDTSTERVTETPATTTPRKTCTTTGGHYLEATVVTAANTTNGSVTPYEALAEANKARSSDGGGEPDDQIPRDGR